MIPYALLQCTIIAVSGKQLALRVLTLSDRYFTVRVCTEDAAVLLQASSIRISFFMPMSGPSRHLECPEFRLVQEACSEFWDTFRIFPQSVDFPVYAREFSKAYLQLIRLKLSEDDATLSEALTGYPAAAEQIFCSDYHAQYLRWMNHLQPEADWGKTISSAAEIAIWLDRPSLWDTFLTEPFPDFFRHYVRDLHLSSHPFAELSPDTVYLGNQYCAHLTPDPSLLARLLKKAALEDLHPVIVFPPIREAGFPEAAARIDTLAGLTSEKPELIINDWGTLHFLKTQYAGVFQLTAGSLLFRYARDPRLRWQPALNEVPSAGISKDNETILQQSYGISAVSADLASFPEDFTALKRCLQLPFYQTNTSSDCPLYAVCRNGQRGKQEYTASCPQFCREYCFLYPSFLNMIGIGNSLFGFSSEGMERSDPFRSSLRPGIDRLVFAFP